MGAGNLRLSSSPPGAEVYRNGKKLNKVTPCKIKGKGKICSIELKKEGYYSRTLQFTRATSPFYSTIAYVWAIPIYWPAIPFIPIDILFGGTKIYYRDNDKRQMATRVWKDKNISYAQLSPGVDPVDKTYALSYSFFPKEYNSVKKIERKLPSCLIYSINEKKYKHARWSGKIVDGYAEGHGLGFYDTYNSGTNSKFVYGGKIEGDLAKGKPNGYCDIINTTSMGPTAGMINPYFYARFSGKFSDGLLNGEVLSTMSEPIAMNRLSNVKYMLIRYSNGEQYGDGFLFDEKNQVLAQGTTRNGRLVIEDNWNNKDFKTILTIVGVTVGAAIILEKGLDYLHDYYATYGYSSTSSGSSSSGPYSSGTYTSGSSTGSSENSNSGNSATVTIDKIVFDGEKYMVSVNGATLPVTLQLLERAGSLSSVDIYQIKWNENNTVKSYNVYQCVENNLGMSKGVWYRVNSNTINNSDIGSEKEDVIKYFINRYYLK